MFLPNTGQVYKFKFIDEFSSLDGIYSVEEILSYERMLETGSTLDAVCKRVGLNTSYITKNISTLRSDRILKLRPCVKGGEMVIIHFSAVSTAPDPSVKVYPKTTLVVDLGPVTDVDQLSYIKNHVEQLMKELGNDSIPLLHAYDKMNYMTQVEFAEIEKKRLDRKKEYRTYKMMYDDKIKECEELKAKVKALNKIILSLTSRS